MADKRDEINLDSIRTWIWDNGISLVAIIISLLSLFFSYKQSSIGVGSNTKDFGRVVKWRPELIPLGLAFFRESGQTRCNNRRAAL